MLQSLWTIFSFSEVRWKSETYGGCPTGCPTSGSYFTVKEALNNEDDGTATFNILTSQKIPEYNSNIFFSSVKESGYFIS